MGLRDGRRVRYTVALLDVAPEKNASVSNGTAVVRPLRSCVGFRDALALSTQRSEGFKRHSQRDKPAVRLGHIDFLDRAQPAAGRTVRLDLVVFHVTHNPINRVPNLDFLGAFADRLRPLR